MAKVKDSAKRNMAWYRDTDIVHSMNLCVGISASGIFNGQFLGSPLYQAAITSILIHLNDLLQKAAAEGHRVTDRSDVPDGIDDVTALINKARNAACHIGSAEHNIPDGKFTWNFFYGRIGDIARYNGHIFRSEYADDVAIFIGMMRVYLRRHIFESLRQCSIYFAKRMNRPDLVIDHAFASHP